MPGLLGFLLLQTAKLLSQIATEQSDECCRFNRTAASHEISLFENKGLSQKNSTYFNQFLYIDREPLDSDFTEL